MDRAPWRVAEEDTSLAQSGVAYFLGKNRRVISGMFRGPCSPGHPTVRPIDDYPTTCLQGTLHKARPLDRTQTPKGFGLLTPGVFFNSGSLRATSFPWPQMGIPLSGGPGIWSVRNNPGLDAAAPPA